MLIGTKVDESIGRLTADDWIEQTRAAAAAGFSSIWSTQLFHWDALTMLAVAGRAVPGVALGTAIVPTYPRHPLMLASQALTVQAVIGNRLSLGIATGAQFIIEHHFGYSFAKPARHLREYVAVLAPLLRGESVSYQGETLKVTGEISIPGAEPPSLLLGALGPLMLTLAGEMADGTLTALTGPTALANYVVPTITRAAEAAGRPAPRVVAGVSVSVTAGVEQARALYAEQTGFLGQMPVYRAMLDREGVTNVEEIAIVGDETTVERELRRYADAGASEVIASAFGPDDDRARTIALLGDLAPKAAVLHDA